MITQTHEIGSDLVVMLAREGESPIAKIIGSTTNRVIRAACSPVLMAKRAVTQACERVVATDTAAVVAFVTAQFPSSRRGEGTI
jgi:hypothetical protein